MLSLVIIGFKLNSSNQLNSFTGSSVVKVPLQKKVPFTNGFYLNPNLITDSILIDTTRSKQLMIYYCKKNKDQQKPFVSCLSWSDSLKNFKQGPWVQVKSSCSVRSLQNTINNLNHSNSKESILIEKYVINRKDNTIILPQISPIGGVYLGKGVMPGGMIDIEKAGEGIHLITYLHINNAKEITFEKHFYVSIIDSRSKLEKLFGF